MPPPHHKHGKHGHTSSSALASLIDIGALSQALTPWLPDAEERAFVLRCVLDEGPAHHRGANYVLLTLLTRLCRALGATAPVGGAQRPFAMRLPPHLEESVDDATWPVSVPLAALEPLAPAGTKQFEAAVDCVTDGPPQHAVANVLMLQLLAAALAKVGPTP